MDTEVMTLFNGGSGLGLHRRLSWCVADFEVHSWANSYSLGQLAADWPVRAEKGPGFGTLAVRALQAVAVNYFFVEQLETLFAFLTGAAGCLDALNLLE